MLSLNDSQDKSLNFQFPCSKHKDESMLMSLKEKNSIQYNQTAFPKFINLPKTSSASRGANTGHVSMKA